MSNFEDMFDPSVLFEPADEGETKEEKKEEEKVIEKEEITSEGFDINTAFEDPESVASEEDKKDKVETPTDNKQDSSPNLISSFATQLVEEGVLTDLDDEELANITDYKSLVDAIEKQAESRLNDKQKRINDALKSGGHPNIIQQFESTIDYLDSITEDQLTSDSEEGVDLRKRLIYNSYVQSGMKQERAIKMMNKLFEDGGDIEEAQDVLEEMKESYKERYKNYVSDIKAQQEKEKEKQEKARKQLEDDILNSTKVFDTLEVDKSTRRKIYATLNDATIYDKDNDMYLTELQDYQRKHPTDFAKNVAILYTLTDGFTSLNKLIGKQVKKEKQKMNNKFEEALKNSYKTNEGGALDLMGRTGTTETNTDVIGLAF